MIKYEDKCVGCPPGMECLGSSCPKKNVPYLICDKCGEVAEELYEYEGEELCEECLLNTVRKVIL